MFHWIRLWTWTVLSIFLELSYGCIVLDHHLGVLLFEVTTSKSSQSDLDQYWKELLFYCHEFITIRLRHKFLMVVDDTKVNSGSWNESAKISASSFGCSIQTVKPTSLMHTWLVFFWFISTIHIVSNLMCLPFVRVHQNSWSLQKERSCTFSIVGLFTILS